jgi:hypothetical protein
MVRPFAFWVDEGPLQPYLTAEERLERQGRQRQRLDARQTCLQRREQAIRRSRELLRACLEAEQLNQFDSTGFFLVRGRLYDYRINHGRTANVDLIERDGRCMRRLCFYPVVGGGRDLLPVFDVMLAQKLMLESDEERALAIAVDHPYLS